MMDISAHGRSTVVFAGRFHRGSAGGSEETADGILICLRNAFGSIQIKSEEESR